MKNLLRLFLSQSKVYPLIGAHITGRLEVFISLFIYLSVQECGHLTNQLIFIDSSFSFF